MDKLTILERKLATYEILANYREYAHDEFHKGNQRTKAGTPTKGYEILTPSLTSEQGWLFIEKDIERKGICPYPSPNKKRQIYMGKQSNNEILEFDNFRYKNPKKGKRKDRSLAEKVVRIKRDLKTFKKLIVLFMEGNTERVRKERGENEIMLIFGTHFPISDYWRDNSQLITELITEMNTTLSKMTGSKKSFDITYLIYSDFNMLTYEIVYWYCKDRKKFVQALHYAAYLTEEFFPDKKDEAMDIAIKSLVVADGFKHRYNKMEATED